MLLLAHKLELGLMVLLLGLEHQNWLFASALADFPRMRPQEVLFVFWNPAFDKDVVRILFLVSVVPRTC